MKLECVIPIRDRSEATTRAYSEMTGREDGGAVDEEEETTDEDDEEEEEDADEDADEDGAESFQRCSMESK